MKLVYHHLHVLLVTLLIMLLITLIMLLFTFLFLITGPFPFYFKAATSMRETTFQFFLLPFKHIGVMYKILIFDICCFWYLNLLNPTFTLPNFLQAPSFPSSSSLGHVFISFFIYKKKCETFNRIGVHSSPYGFHMTIHLRIVWKQMANIIIISINLALTILIHSGWYLLVNLFLFFIFFRYSF